MILIVLESSPTCDYYDIIIIMLINMRINIIDDDYYYDNPQ